MDGSAVFEAGVDRSGELPAGINEDGLCLRLPSDGGFQADCSALTPGGIGFLRYPEELES